MNTFVTFACLLLVGFSQANPVGYGLGYGYGYGLGAPILTSHIIAPAAVSTANMVKAAPIPIIKTTLIPAPVVAPITTVPVLKSVNIGLGGLHGGYGLGYGGLGLGYGGLGYGGLSYGYGLGKH